MLRYSASSNTGSLRLGSLGFGAGCGYVLPSWPVTESGLTFVRPLSLETVALLTSKTSAMASPDIPASVSSATTSRRSMANFHALRYFTTEAEDARPDNPNPTNSVTGIDFTFEIFDLPSWVNAHTMAARFHSDAVISSPKPLVLTRSIYVVHVVGVRGLGEPRRQQRGDDEHRL